MRLPDYDYTRPGYYFVTACTKNRAEIFGSINDGKMVLSEFGWIVQRCWLELPSHYVCRLDAFVIMPNHLHGIISLPWRRETADSQKKNIPTYQVAGGFKPPATQTKRHALQEIIRGFKTFSSRRINERCGTPGRPVWQVSFYEHIIRSERALWTIREYIRRNPVNWESDRNNPERRV